MDTREHRVIESPPIVSGDAAYGQALAKFGRRPVRSFVKLVGFVSLVCGVAAAQTAATSPTVVQTNLKLMIAVFFAVAVIGMGLWFVDSVRKHPQAYANAFKALGILLVLGFVAHRIRRGMVNIVADGVAEGEKRAQRDDWTSL